ncbi:coiled-coil domain-containing protein 50 isoform X2 [Hemicordylus capensis]|uniref:coiled-coil domain-containing protein 50 isoform X2 n=1 Tax=Hemicordylus capensis TaxID=884348 RepID=UPI0023046DBA|nr:coiled-coil domain-containing protein 50 isoform X2 [Hemicordylus capensis]
MAELGIDQSKLPGVKEVCRDFAVLEDHTLAHNLQEQEIEHHLATNIQRNRLVQHDLQMAKQLQEEEDRRAHARTQEHHKDRERQDCEIAQEIQVKLVIEAEQRRRQEEDDEDIARILQQRELQEEKRRKKPPPEPLQHGPYEEGYCPESREHSCASPREPAAEPTGPRQPGSGDRQPPQPREHRRGLPLVSEGLDLDVLGSSAEVGKARGGQRRKREKRERNAGSQEKPCKSPLDLEDDYVGRSSWGSRSCRDVEPSGQEGARGPSSLLLDGEAEHRGGGRGESRERRERRPRSRERTQRPTPPRTWERKAEGEDFEQGNRVCKRQERHSPSFLGKSPRPPHRNADREESHPGRQYSNSHSPNPDCRRPPREDRQSPRASRDPRLLDTEAPHRRGRRKEVEREDEGAGSRERASPRHGEDLAMDPGCRRNPGTKPRGAKEAIYQKPRPASQESYDAEIARKLQEEELLASQVDKRAAQVAQDEEIARLLMAEEKKAYRKAKEREKVSSEKKRRDQDWKNDPHELVHPRSREDHESHRPRSHKPTRPPPPPTEDLSHPSILASQHSSAQISKPEPSQKGYHYKQ